MLAQSFKTPAELEISEVIFDALVTVLGMLDRGEIEVEAFNMNEWWEPRRNERGQFCGTLGCIGGWVGYVARQAGHKFDVNHPLSRGLCDLYHPPYLEGRYTIRAWDASRAQAAQALRNYLTTGEARWAEVMR